jgi:hypothetical protein
VDKHRANLLAATHQQLEKELSSCAARGASPVVGDDAVAEPEPEQDSPGCSVDLETPESLAPVVNYACRLGGKKRRFVTVQDYPWKFVSPQLLDYKGTEIMYPVEDDRDRWWARRLEDTVNHHRDLADRDLDGLQAYSLDVVRRVQQKMEKEKCCFCLGRNEHENRCT